MISRAKFCGAVRTVNDLHGDIEELTKKIEDKQAELKQAIYNHDILKLTLPPELIF